MSTLKNGPKHYLTCANCKARLLEIWVTLPQEKTTWKIKGNCPFCNDKSYIKEITGGFHISGVARPSDEEDIDFLVTTYDPPEVKDNVYNFKIRKANPDVKPIK